MTDLQLHDRFISLLETNLGIILKISKAYTHTAQDREDLVNEIAYQMWKAFPNFKAKSKISTWIYRVALNTAMNYQKNTRKQRDFLKDSVGFYSDEPSNESNSNPQVELLMKVLKQNSEKRIDGLKVHALAGMLLPLILLIFIVLPRVQFTLELQVVIGIILFVPLYIISYIWVIKLYIHIEKVNPNSPLTTVSKQLKLLQKYKLKTTRNNYILAPFFIVGIFLAAGIPFLSLKMIPFYVLMVISF